MTLLVDGNVVETPLLELSSDPPKADSLSHHEEVLATGSFDGSISVMLDPDAPGRTDSVEDVGARAFIFRKRDAKCMMLWDSEVDWANHGESVPQGDDEPVKHFFEGFDCLPEDEARFANVPVRVSLEFQTDQTGPDSDDEDAKKTRTKPTVSRVCTSQRRRMAIGVKLPSAVSTVCCSRLNARSTHAFGSS
eukprot:COSAG04_NODE_319_length_16893_cov_23.060141_16_plen_192_part_00